MYLSRIRLFQRHLTTGAFKVAGGADLLSSASSSRLMKQNAVSPTFLSKVTKAFLDTLYAFLDGMVHLASDEFPKLPPAKPGSEVDPPSENDPLELLDIENAVSMDLTGLGCRALIDAPSGNAPLARRV